MTKTSYEIEYDRLVSESAKASSALEEFVKASREMEPVEPSAAPWSVRMIDGSGWVDIIDANKRTVAGFYGRDPRGNTANAQMVVDLINARFSPSEGETK